MHFRVRDVKSFWAAVPVGPLVALVIFTATAGRLSASENLWVDPRSFGSSGAVDSKYPEPPAPKTWSAANIHC